jgi:predicted RNA-binding protein YlxR (DUF448 family)
VSPRILFFRSALCFPSSPEATMGKRKHIPIRTCVACRETDEKRDLMRIVRQSDGSVCYDPKGKISGRGAYLCARPVCVELARKRKQLERSLKVSGIPSAFFDELIAYAVSRANSSAAAAGEESPFDGSANGMQTPANSVTNSPGSHNGQATGSAVMRPDMLIENEGETI